MPENAQQKIGIYTACNNAKYLERSLFSVSTADYIVAIVLEDNKEAKKVLDNLSMMLPQLIYISVTDKDLESWDECARAYLPEDTEIKIPLLDGEVFPADWREQVAAAKNSNPKDSIKGITNMIPPTPAYKIAVYAISGNELFNIEGWILSMWEADYICVLDTGSTDGSWEKWQEYKEKYPEKLFIARKTFNPWRFDYPRNESMKLIPNDADICISTDLDERLTPTWADKVRQAWRPGCQRAYYLYAWSHLLDGSPARVFWYDKIHANSGLWKWKFPVHEALWHPIYKHANLQPYQVACLPADFVMLHHYPDRTKPRANYLPLLKMRYAENPTDLYTVTYLAHEFKYQQQWQEGVDFILNNALPYYDEYKVDKLFYACLYKFLGDCYAKLGKTDEAEDAYKRGIKKDSTYRDNYLQLGKLYCITKRYIYAVNIVNEGLLKSRRHYSWLEGDACWNFEPWDILCAAYWGDKAYDTAAQCAKLAYMESPNDPRLKENYERLQAIVNDYGRKD